MLPAASVPVESATGALATSSTDTLVSDRSQDRFEQVMADLWVNQAQVYIRSLGFGSTLRAVNAQQQLVKLDRDGGDNSHQADKPFRIRCGRGASTTRRTPR